MNIIYVSKKFRKLNPSVMDSIKKGVIKLRERALYYIEQNIPLELVFNDDILKHDVIDGSFFVYKGTVGKLQPRILYTVKDDKLLIIDYVFKESNKKDYLKYFENVVKNFKGVDYYAYCQNF